MCDETERRTLERLLEETAELWRLADLPFLDRLPPDLRRAILAVVATGEEIRRMRSHRPF